MLRRTKSQKSTLTGKDLVELPAKHVQEHRIALGQGSMIDWSPHSSNFLIPTGLFSLYHDAVAMDSFNEPNQRQEERRVYQEVFNFAQGAMETYMAKQKVGQKNFLRLYVKSKKKTFIFVQN